MAIRMEASAPGTRWAQPVITRFACSRLVPMMVAPPPRRWIDALQGFPGNRIQRGWVGFPCSANGEQDHTTAAAQAS